MASVILNGITKRYGGVTAVENVNLEIQDHEFVVLVGPSGCGKSTTLRMIAGLEEISGGEISIGDRVVNELAPKDRDIAMVFQSYALYPHMNVYDNLAFALKLRKVSKTEIDRRVRETAKLLGIEDLLNRKPKALSGGQRQRVALGRAIVREPKVFLMDEPLSNLDAKLRVQMRAELARLQNRLHITTIYVTHDQIEAMTMGDRIVVMKDGKVQQVGTPLHIYRHPDNMFVAGFIGTPPTNFFKVRLQKEGGQLLADFGSFRMVLPKTMARWESYQNYAGQEVFLGLRPEYIVDVEFHPESPADYCVDAMVDVVEMMGSEAYLHSSVGNHTFVARVEPKTTAKDGTPHRLCLQLEWAHLFDPATTATIR